MASLSQPEGYDTSFCMECGNSDSFATRLYPVQQILRCDDRLGHSATNTKQIYEEGILRYQEDKKGGIFNNYIKTYRTFVPDIFANYFTNDNTDGMCPITTCKLMNPGCVGDASSDHVRLELVAGKWAMQAHLMLPYGFKENFCISCTNGNSQYERQSITFDNYKVDLPSKCTYAMEQLSTVTENQFYTYVHDDANLVDKVFTNGFTKFFKNVDTTNCPIEHCKLKERGCKSSWTGGDGDNIDMETESPWAVTIKDNTFAGYGTDKICVECDNSY